MERRKFEDSFQEAFKNAEINPSESVWTNIELDLERANGDQMKRRLVFFKTLAAASVIFAVCVGGVLYFTLSDDQTKARLAQKNTTGITDETNTVTEDENKISTDKENKRSESSVQNKSEFTDEKLSDKVEASESGKEDLRASKPLPQPGSDESLDKQKNSSVTEELSVAGGNSQSQTPPLDKDVSLGDQENEGLSKENDATYDDRGTRGIDDKNSSKNTLAIAGNDQIPNEVTSRANDVTSTSIDGSEEKSRRGIAEGTERELPSFYQPAVPSLQLPQSTADAGMIMLARLADEEKKYAADQKTGRSKSEKLWTSVGFAAGAFNSNNPSVATPPANTLHGLTASNLQTATKQSQASGIAYSLGVSVGTQISNRWVLQGGLNYMNQSSDYTANSVVVVDNNYSSLKAESLNVFASQTADLSAQPKVAQTFPYNVNNSVRFVSLPVQAGYLLVNRKFGVQLNAGVSTDLFLQNTITPDGGGVTKTTQGRGEDSPYRSLNFSGLMGTEFSYKLSNRYRVSVNPGLRYPFSSVYKSNTGIDATPLTFDVGLRFRYIFH